MADDLRQAVKEPLEQVLLDQEQDAVIKAPDDKGPGSAVPDAGKKPDDHDVADVPQGTFPVAAQGDIDILPEPGPQGDMPSAPEFGSAQGHIGIIEVLGDGEAKHLADADGHIRITAEVKIDLQGKGPDHKPGQNDRHLRIRQGRDLAVHIAEAVRQQDLLAQAADKHGHAGGDLRPVEPVGAKLRRKVHIADDGSGGDLCKEGHENPVVDEIYLGRLILSVHIDQIGQDREGKKGNTDGQGQLLFGQGCVKKGIQVIDHKAVILEKAKDGHVENDTGDQADTGSLLRSAVNAALHLQGREIVKDHGQAQDDQVGRIAPGIENKAGQQEEYIFEDSRQDIVSGHAYRKKDKDKNQTADTHFLSPPIGWPGRPHRWPGHFH